MKKIIKLFIFIWLFYLIYLNFFYKGPKRLCAMGTPAESAIIIALFSGILWVGLPFSYLLKDLFLKFYNTSLTKNESLPAVERQGIPLRTGQVPSSASAKAKIFSPPKSKILQMFFVIAMPFAFIFLLPFIFGMLIIFRALPSSLQDIIFSNSYLSFILQFLGLLYIYLGFSGKFNKFLLK